MGNGYENEYAKKLFFGKRIRKRKRDKIFLENGYENAKNVPFFHKLKIRERSRSLKFSKNRQP